MESAFIEVDAVVEDVSVTPAKLRTEKQLVNVAFLIDVKPSKHAGAALLELMESPDIVVSGPVSSVKSALLNLGLMVVEVIP